MRRAVLALACAGLVTGGLMFTAGAAQAHPLGNFTINHYDGLRFSDGRIQDLAVVDSAEIPTVQERPMVDADGDGSVSVAERSAHAARSCADLTQATQLTVNGATVAFALQRSSFEYRPGAAGLETSRLECALEASLPDLQGSAPVEFRNGYREDRIGWREITATADDGVRLTTSSVPAASISQELRSYPDDLLSSPLALTEAVLKLSPGSGVSASSAVDLPTTGLLGRWTGELSTRFDELAATRNLTPTVGLLAVLLAMLLGASHAALPGHGKTVIAAYLAGRRGTTRDALTVGLTVTVTHTAGVIVLGLLLSAAVVVAGETVLAGLGVASGLLIASIGAWLLYAAVKRPRTGDAGGHVVDLTIGPEPGHEPGHEPSGAVRGRGKTSVALRGTTALVITEALAPPTHDHEHGDGHEHGHGLRHENEPGHGHAPGHELGHDHGHGHGHEPSHGLGRDPRHENEPGHGHGHENELGHGHGHALGRELGHGHGHGLDHGHGHGLFGHGHGLFGLRTASDSESARTPLGRMTLIGMGVAGGLVPSPSALVVLLGAIGLGRTWFGILLVIGYGVGMAGLLTAVGLLLVRFSDRLREDALPRYRALRNLAERWARWVPSATASLVLIVGLALTVRAAGPLVG